MKNSRAIPRPPAYFSVRCLTCKTSLCPVVATSPGELLAPDYEAVAVSAGVMNAEWLRDFLAAHSGHDIKATRDRKRKPGVN